MSGIDNRMTRRRFTAGVLALAATLPIGVAGRASAASRPVRLRLPRPTGPYPVGTTELHLVDRGRPDQAAGPGRFRELMASVWYPAGDAGRCPRAPWLPQPVLRELLASAGFAPDAATTPLTAGHVGAPVRAAGRRPVVVYSHGAHDHRAGNTIVVQELASHGYVVVTVDHTHDAFSRFPDGRVVVPSDDPDVALGPAEFAEDLRFVLDTVEDLAAGRNPDAGRRPLPAGLGRAIDPRRIGMFGWSKGGTATARVMVADRRVRAGLSLDGPMLPLITAGLDRPFLLMTAEFTRAAEPAVADFWSRLRGWRLDLRAAGAAHSSYTDYQVLYPQVAKAVGMSDDDLRQQIGTLDPHRAVRIEQAYPLAFFDRHLRGRRTPLLDGPSAAFPEVAHLP